MNIINWIKNLFSIGNKKIIQSPQVEGEIIQPPQFERKVSFTLEDVIEPDLFPGGQSAFNFTIEGNDIIIDPVDSGSGWRKLEVVNHDNLNISVSKITSGSYLPAKVSIGVIDNEKDALANIRVTNQYHGIFINYKNEKIKPIEPPVNDVGYLKINTVNKRFVDSKTNEVFYPLGLQDCFGLHEGDINWGVEGKVLDTDAYLSMYKSAGFNLFRWSIGNCNYLLNNEENFIKGDAFITKLKQYGFRVQFVFFMNTVDTSPSGLNYVKKCIDRYGDKVDIWEVCNESTSSNQEQKVILDFIKLNDKFKHLITTSFRYVYPVLPEILNGSDFVSPHLYTYGINTNSGKEIDDVVNTFNKYNLPIQFGEFGYASVNWQVGADDTNRVNAFVSFFLESSLVYWNQSFSRPYSNPNSVANIYLGSETQKFLKSFTEFKKLVPRDSKIGKITTSPKVKSYLLEESNKKFGYLFKVDAVNDININLTFEKIGIINWINPSINEIISKTNITTTGNQNIVVPSFSIDLAFIYEGNGTPQPDNKVYSITFEKEIPSEIGINESITISPVLKNKNEEILYNKEIKIIVSNSSVLNSVKLEDNTFVLKGISSGETSFIITSEDISNTTNIIIRKPIIIEPPRYIEASDFPADTIGKSIELALASINPANGGTVIARNGGILDRNNLIESNKKLILKDGLFQMKTMGLASGRCSAFFLDHNSKLFGENATIRENLAPNASGNESPYNIIAAYRAMLYEENQWGIPYTGVTENIEINGLKLLGHKENPFDGGGNSAIYLGNTHGGIVKNIEADGIHSYIAEAGGFGWLATTAKNILFENITGKHIATQNMAIILCDTALIKNLYLSEPGTPPYEIADIRPTSSNGVVIELAENCHVRDGSLIELRSVKGIDGINDNWQVGKINNRTYELIGRVDGNGILIPNSKPKFNGKWITGSGMAIGAVVTFQGFDYEPNGGGLTIPAQNRIREKIMVENSQYPRTFWDSLDNAGWYPFELTRWNITKNEITEADMSERLIDIVMEDSTFNFRNQWSPSGGAIAFQATNFDIINYGNKFRRIKIFGDLRGKTTVGMQMSKFTTDLEVDDMEINDCSAGFVASGDKIKVNNLRMKDCGRGGNAALELLDCTNSEFSNIRMETGGRGNPTISEGGANSGNKFSEIYSDDVKIK